MNKYQIWTILLLGVFLVAGCASNSGPTGKVVAKNDNPIAPQTQKEITIKGSDTILQLVSNMAETYAKKDKSVKISVTGGGSGTGIASLINGEIDVADSSRKIKDKEISDANAKGVNPWEIIIARDSLTVIVNKDNPIKELTIPQLSSIFKGEVTNWKELGGRDEEITLYGRQSTSGTYIYFMEEVVKGDYSPKMRNMEGNQAILDAVVQDKSGIGYVGRGYVMSELKKGNSDMKVINVAKDKDSKYYDPTIEENVAVYPISRELYQYLSQPPKKGTTLYNFIMFELSAEGKQLVKDSGFDDLIAKDEQHNKEVLALIK